MSPFLAESTSPIAIHLSKNKESGAAGGDLGKAKLTMAEASEIEWCAIENAIRTVLPGKLPYVKGLPRGDAGLWHERYFA